MNVNFFEVLTPYLDFALVFPGGREIVARLWLAAASATALRAGLDLLGVDVPDRL